MATLERQATTTVLTPQATSTFPNPQGIGTFTNSQTTDTFINPQPTNTLSRERNEPDCDKDDRTDEEENEAPVIT